MKSIKITFLTLCSLALLFVGCTKDKIEFGDNSTSTNTDIEIAEGCGKLVLNPSSVLTGLVPEVMGIDSDGTNGDDETKSAPATKTDDTVSEYVPASGDYIITITLDKETSVTHTYTYAELQTLGEKGVDLMPGIYTIEAKTPDNDALAQIDAPTYAGKVENVVIKKGELTAVDEIKCVLTNIKTSLVYSADMFELFQKDNVEGSKNLVTTFTVGGGSMGFSREDVEGGKTVYFYPAKENNTLQITLEGTFNNAAENEEAEYIDIDWTQEIPNVKAGQWRQITLNVMGAHTGNSSFVVTVDTWAYDEVVDVKTFELAASEIFGEEELDDPENEITDPYSPIVTLTGKIGGTTGSDQNINEVFKLYTASFDFDAQYCNSTLMGAITPDNATISEVYAEIETDNESLKALLSSNYTKNRVSLYPTNQISSYTTITSGSGEFSPLSFKSNFTGMNKLFSYGGTHKIKFAVTDSQNRESYTTLTILVDRTGAPDQVLVPPAIVWRGGYDFATRHKISANGPNLDFIFDITSENGLTGFLIEITGNALTKTDLTGMNLAASMDLINPTTDDMSEALGALGFPVGDDVKGAKELVFDITQFMPMLAGLGAPDGATQDFKLIVSDDQGTTTVTLKVEVDNSGEASIAQ